MDKTNYYKPKNKKQPAAKPKTTKKRKNDGPSCSLFLAEITKKLAAGRRQDLEAPKNIIRTIIDSVTNALPIIVSKKSPPKIPSPVQIESLQTLSPELLPNDTISVPHTLSLEVKDVLQGIECSSEHPSFKIPKMPVVSSELFRNAIEKHKKEIMTDATTSTSVDHDMATEITKYVSTLRKISLIAEEFNQKTAKNLKEIVDSVQEDLVKKLEEVQARQKAEAIAQAQALKLQEESNKEVEEVEKIN